MTIKKVRAPSHPLGRICNFIDAYFSAEDKIVSITGGWARNVKEDDDEWRLVLHIKIDDDSHVLTLDDVENLIDSIEKVEAKQTTASPEAVTLLVSKLREAAEEAERMGKIKPPPDHIQETPDVLH